MSYTLLPAAAIRSEMNFDGGIYIAEGMGRYCVPISHAGYCCGITTIYNFPHDAANFPDKGYKYIAEYLKVLVPKLTKQETRRGLFKKGHTRLLEIVVTDKQSKALPIIRKAGFRRVASFRNINSGNMCYVYHCIPKYEEKK